MECFILDRDSGVLFVVAAVVVVVVMLRSRPIQNVKIGGIFIKMLFLGIHLFIEK